MKPDVENEQKVVQLIKPEVENEQDLYPTLDVKSENLAKEFINSMSLYSKRCGQVDWASPFTGYHWCSHSFLVIATMIL